MKLSELIAYRNLLLQYDTDDIQYPSYRQLEAILYTVKTNTIQPRAFSQTLDEDLAAIKYAAGQFTTTLSELIKELNIIIEIEEKSYYAESSQDYKQVTDRRYHRIVQSEDILKRIIQLPDESRQMIVNRIRGYIDWKQAGMIIRPGREDFIKHLVECDPLYIVDHDSQLLEESVAQFNEEYQQRIRSHYINNVEEHPNESLIGTVPGNQIGFCLSYNFFNFVAMEVLEQYLKEIFSKLKPGGILAMTFNDCDKAHGVALAEKHYCFYTPGHRILSTAKRIGYKQMFKWDDGRDFSWLELRKPGESESLKGGQTLAKILPKTLAKSK